MDIEKLFDEIGFLFLSGEFSKIIDLCEKSIVKYPDDVRLNSTLCRCYERLIPFVIYEFSSIPDDYLKLYSNYAIKSIKHGERALLSFTAIPLDSESDISILTYGLKDLANILLTRLLIIQEMISRKWTLDQFGKLNDNLLTKLKKYYKKGFLHYDDEFESYTQHKYNYEDLLNHQ